MDKLKWDKNFALEQAADDAELLQELIDIFKDSCLKDYDAIKEGVTVMDAEKICAAAHSIKGAAASLGIEGIRDVALDIESDSRNGSCDIAGKRLDDLHELLEHLQKL